jgi:hypothetical protein
MAFVMGFVWRPFATVSGSSHQFHCDARRTNDMGASTPCPAPVSQPKAVLSGLESYRDACDPVAFLFSLPTHEFVRVNRIFSHGRRSTPGTMSETSQLDWLIRAQTYCCTSAL